MRKLIKISMVTFLVALVVCSAFAQWIDPCTQTARLSQTAEGVQVFTRNSAGNRPLEGTPYGWEMWTVSPNENKLIWFGPNQGGGAAFRTEWTNPRNYLGRIGLFMNEGKHYSEYKNIYADYNYTRSENGTAGGYSYIGIYGWTKNPQVEWYIVEDWYGEGILSSLRILGTYKGDFVTSDGVEYKIYRNDRPPGSGSILGDGQGFPQYFSVRQRANPSPGAPMCGSIAITEHFKKWDTFEDMKMGKDLYEAKFLIEAGGGTGWFEANYIQFFQEDQPRSSNHQSKYTYRGAGNPYLPLWEHLPDGEPRVFEDPDNPGKYRFYIIGSHDLRFTSYCGPDIRIWSAPVEDLSEWRDEGPVFTYPIDGQWDVMYAPDLVEVRRKDGTKEYYLYPHSRGPNREAMVAKGNRPDGPFTPINLTADGLSTVPGSIMGFDPSVYIEYITDPNDPDYETGFRAYGYWGFQRSLAAELDQNTMYSLRPGKEIINCFIPASSRYGVIRDPEGTVYPHVFPDEDLSGFNFFEAASIRKVGNKYVWVYSGYSGPDYGLSSTNSALRYAFGDSPLGPWRSGGVLVDSRAPVLGQIDTALQTGYAAHNTHGSIELINDQWYAFYHRPPRGFGNARQPMVAPVAIEWDEKPVAEGGRVTIRAYDPYSENKIWTAKDSRGREYTGAEVTSEGFHIYGLDPYQYYSAGYACYLSDINLQQDSWDIWDNHAPITSVSNGHIIGYKYFGFGGLDQDKKGLKAFEGTRPGNNTKFNLFITPKTPASFKVNVWLDGPWDNDTWKGTKIGEIEVPANSARETTQFSIDVSQYVDHLNKKHAIFLVAEGGGRGPGGRPFGQGGLFDLIGLGFSSDKKNIVRHIAPQVSISANNIVLDLPEHPVRSTNANGIVGYDLYETQVTLTAGTASIPAVAATASDSDVKIAITQADSVSGIAVVKFDYKGVIKTYRVVFAKSTD